MKKFLFSKALAVFLTLFGFSWSVSAQSDVFIKDDVVIHLGVGLGNYISHKGYSNWFAPIVASFEYGVVDNMFDSKAGIGIGGYAAYTSFKGNSNKDSWGVSDFIIGARGIFHYQFVDNLDTYAGIMLGYDIVSFNQSDPDLTGSKFRPGYFIGARYYFTDNIAVFGELGYNTAPLEIGLCYKF